MKALIQKSLRKGFTLIELLVVISIIALLAALAVPAVLGGLTRAQLTQALSNARQIYIAAQTMALDAVSTGDASLGWPGDLKNAQVSPVNNVTQYVERLVAFDYLKAGDLKVFATAGVTPASSAKLSGTTLSGFDGNTNSGFKIYTITEQDAGQNILLATKNFTAYSEPAATAVPFGDKGFVIFRKGGDGSVLKKAQAKSPTVVGLLPGKDDASNAGTESGSDILAQQ